MDELLSGSLARLDGVARHGELVRAGVARRNLAAAWREGEILRVRHGVYAEPGLPASVVKAVRVGGVLAGASACGLLGLWEPPRSALHVSVVPHARALRDPEQENRPLDPARGDVVVLYDREAGWGAGGSSAGGAGGGVLARRPRRHVGLRTCLRQTITRSEPRVGLAVLDSAVRAHGLTAADLLSLRAELPARCRRVVDRADASAESGSESIMRWGLVEAGLSFEAQKRVGDGIRVDFLVAGRVVVECVSHEFHAGRREYERDRARIAAVARTGRTVLEFTHHQVLDEWPMVIGTILAAVVRG